MGWPTYAWLPYLNNRFAGKFEFVHLVRNPFHTAASLLSHGQHVGDSFVSKVVIFGSDPHLAYPEFRDSYAGFSPYERCLYHWLELNRFLLDYSGLPSSRGVFRFEDLYQSEDSKLQELASVILNRPVASLSSVAVDRAHRALVEPIQIDNQSLIRAVLDLSIQLGYDEDELQETLNISAIAKRYGSLRLVA